MPSWTPEGPAGPFGRPSWARGDPSGGRLGGQEPRTVGFADSSSENAVFVQAAGRAQAAGRVAPAAKSPRRKHGAKRSLQNFCID